MDLPRLIRQKFEQLMTELIHERDVTRALKDAQVMSPSEFRWIQEMRLYWEPGTEVPLSTRMANATFLYGFEYLGVAEKLVQTPMTDRAFLTLTQALQMKLGGNPFGPAGTGK